MKDDEIVNCVQSCATPTESANLVVNNAINHGANDCGTAVVIPLGSWRRYKNILKK